MQARNFYFHARRSLISFILFSIISPLQAMESSALSLLNAAQKNRMTDLMQLLDSGADVNEPNEKGLTPLHLAAMAGHKKVVAALLAYDADPSITTPSGQNAMELAEDNGHEELVTIMSVFKQDSVKLKTNPKAATKTDTNTGAPRKKLPSVPQKQPVISGDLHSAISTGDTALITALIAQGKDLEKPNAKGGTPLHAACSKGLLDVAQMLINAGVSLDLVNQFGNTALHIVALQGYDALCKLLVDKGAATNIENGNGHTPLQVAQKSSKQAIIKILSPLSAAEKKSKPFGEKQSQYKVNPSSAVQFSSAEQQLLRNPHQKDPEGSTPLHHAARKGNLALAQQLIERNANVHARDNFQFTPLMAAANLGHLDVIRLLIKEGANVHDFNSMGYSAAHLAVANGQSEALRVLLENGFNPTQKYCYSDNTQGSLYEMALIEIKKGDDFLGHHFKNMISIIEPFVPESAKVVISKSKTMLSFTNVDQVDYAGRTLLILAAIDGDDSKVEQLLEQKANVHLRDKAGLRALDVAIYAGFVRIVELLVKYGADIHSESGYNESPITPLQRAAGCGRAAIVELLLKNKADVSKTDRDGSTALHHVASRSSYGNSKESSAESADRAQAAELLIKAGTSASLSVATKKDPSTPLHLACTNGLLEVAKIFCKYKADPTLKNYQGYTALHLAAKAGHADIVAFLLLQFVPVDLLTKDKRTALHLAAQEGKDDVVRLLIEKKANVRAKDDSYDAYTPLHYASEKGHSAIVSLLLAAGANPKAKALGKRSPIDVANSELIKSLLTKK